MNIIRLPHTTTDATCQYEILHAVTPARPPLNNQIFANLTAQSQIGVNHKQRICDKPGHHKDYKLLVHT